MQKLPLIVITGPTASGKTALAIEIAEKHSGEIICADSRTIYKYLDIGTAKPNATECRRVPHWGLDLLLPNEKFSAADFKEYAVKKIQEIRDRGNIPFLVGGTGLYVDSVIFDYKFNKPRDDELWNKFNSLGLAELHNYCNINNIKLPENKYNKRYVIRAIECNGVNPRRSSSLIDNTVVVGISTDRDVLRERISLRARQMIDQGVVNETRMLGNTYGWDSEAMKSNAYPVICRYIKDEISYDEMVQKLITTDWHLAKRQLTWLKRNKYIKWGSIDNSRSYLNQVLAKGE